MDVRTVILIILLVVNLIASIVYVFVKISRKESIGVVFFFIFLPVMGFAIYFLPGLLSRSFGDEKYDRDSLTHRNDVARIIEHPDMEEELNVVPVEDAMAINENKEKRALLLRQLKKDINENYRVLLAAENDEDSESVHYVAATKMEVYNTLHKRWLEGYKAYEKDKTEGQNYRNACDALKKLIESQVLSGRELKMYKSKYCGLIEEQEQVDKSAICNTDYETYLICLVELGRFDDAEQLWGEKREFVKSENSYMKMTEMYYQRKEKEKFSNCIAELKKDRQVRLSAQGLERLRYWMQRE